MFILEMQNRDFVKGLKTGHSYIRSLTKLSEDELVEIFGVSSITDIINNFKIDDIVYRYVNWLNALHIGDEVMLDDGTPDKFVIVHLCRDTCTLLNSKGFLTSYPKENLKATGHKYEAIKETLKMLSI